MAEPTYIFRDGKVYTMVDGKVVSSVKESEFGDPPADYNGGHSIPSDIEMPPPPDDLGAALGPDGVCPNCGQPGVAGEACPQCGEIVTEGEDPNVPSFDEAAESGEFGPEGHPGHMFAKQTVTTPNGLKGRVLARVPSLWGEEVTVRFENGVIKKIPVDKRLTFAAAEEAPEDQTSVERLEERLATTYQADEASLLQRKQDLQKIVTDASAAVGTSSDEESRALDQLVVQAGYELKEIGSALEHIEATRGEGFEAPASIEDLPTVEQESLGGTKANWLDRTVGEMVAEANSTDYEKLMDEGPEAFVASLDDAQLADAGTVRVMASREIRSHTAGAEEGIREKYEKVWLAPRRGSA
jgi:hypothetical protein